MSRTISVEVEYQFHKRRLRVVLYSVAAEDLKALGNAYDVYVTRRPVLFKFPTLNVYGQLREWRMAPTNLLLRMPNRGV